MLLTRTKTGEPLVPADEAADFLKVTDTVEHTLIAVLVESATRHCEGYTGRDVRENEYELLRDGFSDDTDSSILLRATLVASITDVSRLVSSVFTTIAASVYYLEPNLSSARVNLGWDQLWPTDLDTQAQNVRVRFKTKAHQDIATCRAGILRHVALMYSDRGDMEGPKTSTSGSAVTTLAISTAKQSGAEQIYGSIALVGM
jgi:hypothetical protein